MSFFLAAFGHERSFFLVAPLASRAPSVVEQSAPAAPHLLTPCSPKTVWPSGLRRQTQVLVERSAWVRTPQLSFFPRVCACAQLSSRRLRGQSNDCKRKPMETTPRGFEPLRAEPNGFLVHLLNHSDTVSCSAASCFKCSLLTAKAQPIRAAGTTATAAEAHPQSLHRKDPHRPASCQRRTATRHAKKMTFKRTSTFNDPPRTRTWNLRLRRPTPYPLGQRASWKKLTPRTAKTKRASQPRDSASATLSLKARCLPPYGLDRQQPLPAQIYNTAAESASCGVRTHAVW